ncbi:MAG: hypothetical protein NZ898_04105 [Myxococcota bacterium]|nr:hypothetical protein [Myxococcota bacterium]MDW8360870.1 hypothetical protein [Myxococcales bacterium]
MHVDRVAAMIAGTQSGRGIAGPQHRKRAYDHTTRSQVGLVAFGRGLGCGLTAAVTAVDVVEGPCETEAEAVSESESKAEPETGLETEPESETETETESVSEAE